MAGGSMNPLFFLYKFKDDSTTDTLSVFVSVDGSVFTGHASKLNIWTKIEARHVLRLTQTLTTSINGDVNAICEVVTKDRSLIVYSVGNFILVYNRTDLSTPLHQLSHNKDEVNQLSVNDKANLMCACDDSGEIKLIDTSTFKVTKTLTAHDNIVSTIKFIPRKPWELISGGLDCKLIRWDFNRGRPLCVLNQSEMLNSVVGSYAINPPMVHSLDVFPSTSTVVCGLGSGTLCVYALKSGRDMTLLCSSDTHRASIACICVNESSISGAAQQFIMSGGSDKRVCVSMIVGDRTQRQSLQLLAQVDVGSKINSLALQEVKDNKKLVIFIADVSSSVLAYSLSIGDFL